MSVLDREPPTAGLRLTYGSLPQQFGDLWLPKQEPSRHHSAHRLPLLIFFHGGWWKSQYSLSYAGFLCEAMRDAGVAVWSVEYRRVGEAGGGWPGTFQDAAAAAGHVLKLAETYPLDLSHVAAAGHSAGGHLAFWLAGRQHVPAATLPLPATPLKLRGVVALAGAVDLKQILSLSGFFEFSSGGPATKALLGGDPSQVPDRYRAGDPAELLPFGIPQALIQGTDDSQIPAAVPQHWAEQAKRQGDPVSVTIVPGADHFDVVDPQSKAWPASRDAMLKMLR